MTGFIKTLLLIKFYTGQRQIKMTCSHTSGNSALIRTIILVGLFMKLLDRLEGLYPDDRFHTH